jgi:hypothetical protein
VLDALAHANRLLTTRAIATMLQFHTTTVRRTLEDLQALKLISCAKGGSGTADGWQLQPQWRVPLRDLLQRLHKVPQPAGTRGKAGVQDRREATPERQPRRAHRARAQPGQGRRAAARPADVEGRQPSA